MKLVTVLACGLCAVIVEPAFATTYVARHRLEGAGQLTDGSISSALDMPLTTSQSIDVLGPDGDTGAFTYNYAGAIRWTGADFEGRAFSLTFDVQFCQSRPEGSGYRFELIADPALETFQGFVVNAHSSPLDLSFFGFDPDPIGSGAGVSLNTPPMQFAGLDSDGHNLTLDMDIGTLSILPAPSAAAVLALAGLFRLRRHR